MKCAAFFDIDGTLVRGMTQSMLTKVMINEKLLTTFQMGQIFLFFYLYKFGLIQNTKCIRQNIYQIFNKYPIAFIETLFKQAYKDYISKRLCSMMKSKVDEHEKRGDLLFAITGSLKELCLPVCEAFRIPNLFATELTVKNGRYDGRWRGDILEGNRKKDLVKGLIDKFEIDGASSYAYADSFTDVALLESVGNPVAVNPDARLRQWAKSHQWEIIENKDV